MSRPSKPFKVISNEKKSHRTKAELKVRQEGEESLCTDTTIKERLEVRENKLAHKEFKRIVKLLEKIDKNDAIYEVVINRYCMLQAECHEKKKKRERFFEDMTNLDLRYEEEEDFTLKEYYSLINNMQKHIVDLDKQIQAKRKMLLDIERENVMTSASALRSIPKKAENDDNPLLKVLRGEA